MGDLWYVRICVEFCVVRVVGREVKREVRLGRVSFRKLGVMGVWFDFKGFGSGGSF